MVHTDETSIPEHATPSHLFRHLNVFLAFTLLTEILAHMSLDVMLNEIFLNNLFFILATYRYHLF